MSKKIILLIIMLIGLSLRLYGINFGLPFVYHADEPIVVNHAMAYGVGDLNPHFFAIPPLSSYMLFFLYGLYFLIGKALHLFTSADNFAIAFLRDPTYFYLIGRVFIGAITGTATIAAIYVLGKKLFSEKIGLLSALFMAVTFIHVQNSHYIYVDIAMTLFIILTCIALLDVVRIKSTRSYIVAGVCAGIAMAIKYNAAVIGVVILAAHFLNYEKKSNAKLLLSFCAMGLAYAILNPYSFIDFTNFVKSVVNQAGTEHGLGMLYHLRYSLVEGIGIALTILGIIGMLYYGIKDPRMHLALISFPVIFYIILCFFSQPHERYVLPLVPFFIIYAAALIHEHIKSSFLSVLLIILILIPNLTKSVYSDLLFTRDDTRTIAGKWINDNIQSGSKIAIEHSFFCPRLNQAKKQIEHKLSIAPGVDAAKDKRLKLAIELAKEKKPYYYVFYLKDKALLDTGFLFEKPQLSFSIPELKNSGVEYAVFHIDTKAATRKDFYQALVDNAVLIKEISPYKNKDKEFSDDVIVQTGGPFLGREIFSRERNGYLIKIFKLGKV